MENFDLMVLKARNELFACVDNRGFSEEEVDMVQRAYE